MAKQKRHTGSLLPLLAVVGPTASGKSDLAVEIAKALGGEVISADSRQVYRGLDLGTGKITKKEMQGVPHHLLDVADPRRAFSVARFARLATKAISRIHAQGKIPIICGGTGLYVDAIVRGLAFPSVPPDPVLRTRLRHMHSDELFALLLTLDQRRAASIDRKNPVRLIRAIEIATALGSVPILPPPTSTFDTLTIGINIAPEVLRQRIHARLLSRMRRGMLAEARKLHTSGVSWKRMEALGLEYRAMARHLKGAITKEDMLHELEHDSVHYAKRQMTWFRRDHTIHWIEHGDTAQAIALACSFFGAQTTPG